MEIFKQLYQAFRGDGVIAHYAKYRFVQFACSVVHFLLVFFFLAIGAYPMAAFNVVSCICYVVSGYYVKKEKYEPLYYVTGIEISLHAVMAAIMVGWEFGFQLYIVAFVPIMFYMHFSLDKTSSLRHAVTIGVCNMLSYILCRLLTFRAEPLYTASEAVSASMYVFNSICTFVMLTVFSLMFMVEMSFTEKQLTEQNEELNIIAGVDALTGLLNRRSMAECLNKAVESGKPFSVLMCDIDDFKKINDTYGHDCGDEILKAVSDTIRGALREFDIICRWGGEEILIIANNSNIEAAANVGERIRSRVDELEIDHDGEKVHCTVTIGAALHESGKTVEETINIADERLYTGKRNGKNRVVSE